MAARSLRIGNRSCSLVALTIPIKIVFLTVLCPPLLQGFDFRGSDNAKTTKRQYKSSNRDSRRCLLCMLVADGTPHRRRPDASGESNLIEHRIQTITEGDCLLPRHFWFPLVPQGLDHLGKPRAAGITRGHLLDYFTGPT